MLELQILQNNISNVSKTVSTMFTLLYTFNARGDIETDISTNLRFIASNIVIAKCVCTYNEGRGVVTVTHNVSYRGNNLPSRQSYNHTCESV